MDIPDRTHAIERRKIFPLMLLQVCAQVMLVPTLFTESALGRREFRPEVDTRAQSFRILGSTKRAVRILTSLLLFLLSILLIGAPVVVCSFRSIVSIGIGSGLASRGLLVDNKPSRGSRLERAHRKQI